MTIKHRKRGFPWLIFLLFLCTGASGFLSSCCNPQPTPTPKIELSSNFVEMQIRNLAQDKLQFPMILSHCRSDSGTTLERTNPFVIRDTTDFLYSTCFANFFEDFDFSKETILYCNLGGVSEVIHSSMNFKVGIDNNTKRVVVFSKILSSGSCAGSDTRSFIYSCLVAVPKFPEDFSVSFEQL